MPGVADLGELDVGHDAGAPPQAGVEEHRQHAARDEAPPQPVAGDPVGRDHAGDRQRRVGGEGGRDHGGAGQPPRHVAAGEEEFVDARLRARRILSLRPQRAVVLQLPVVRDPPSPPTRPWQSPEWSRPTGSPGCGGASSGDSGTVTCLRAPVAAIRRDHRRRIRRDPLLQRFPPPS